MITRNFHTDADRILSEVETATLAGVSSQTLRRMSDRGQGPPRLKISLRRVGYRLRDVQTWLRDIKTVA
jgi:predicted DNA-binding transcriptional regulator AlpA